MTERIQNFKNSLIAINLQGRKIFIWFNELCYNQRAWIVPVLELLLLGFIIWEGLVKFPERLGAKHPGKKIYPVLARIIFIALALSLLFQMTC